MQQLVHLRDLPATLCTRAVLDDPVDLVEKEDRVVGFRLLESAAYVLLRTTDPHGKEITSHLHDNLAPDLPSEILDEFRLARPGRPPEEDVHARTIRRGRPRPSIPLSSLPILSHS